MKDMLIKHDPISLNKHFDAVSKDGDTLELSMSKIYDATHVNCSNKGFMPLFNSNAVSNMMHHRFKDPDDQQ